MPKRLPRTEDLMLGPWLEEDRQLISPRHRRRRYSGSTALTVPFGIYLHGNVNLGCFRDTRLPLTPHKNAPRPECRSRGMLKSRCKPKFGGVGYPGGPARHPDLMRQDNSKRVLCSRCNKPETS